MKKVLALMISIATVLSLAACAGSQSSTTGSAPQSSAESNYPATPETTPSSQDNDSDGADNSTVDAETDEATNDTTENISSSDTNILIAYFTVPEIDGVDAVARASRIVVDGQVVGNTQFVAEIIQGVVGGDLFEIRTALPYPARPDLMDRGANEKSDNARPELSANLGSPNDYDIIFLGYPNWNADMPMALYTFLEQYDFSGKTIVPFCTHGGSGLSNTVRAIADSQPNATVITDAYTVSRDRTPDSASDVVAWVQRLNLAQ